MRNAMTSCEGPQVRLQRDPSLHIYPSSSERAPAGAKAPSRGATPRRDITVLLGGCGSGSHLLPTLIDAADPDRAPELTGACLRVVLNDIVPEAIARIAVFAMFLQRTGAHDALPGANLLEFYSTELSTEAEVAITFLWHIYQSPHLCLPVQQQLQEVLQQLAGAEEPPAAWLQCTEGTWAQVRAVRTPTIQNGISKDKLLCGAVWIMVTLLGRLRCAARAMRCFCSVELRCCLESWHAVRLLFE